MFRRVFLTAIASGIAAGLVLSLLQAATTMPLILEAESFETAALEQPAATAASQPGSQAADEDWAPAEGLERVFYTGLANIIAAVGFGLVLAAGFTLHGKSLDARRGLMWGLAGFAVFSLAPALGLPPELPGTAAAELGERQGWWLLTVALTAAGLWLLLLGSARWMAPVGIAVLAAPHFIGAPHPDALGGNLPAELAGHFVAATLVTAAVFWSLLGALAGSLYARLEPSA